MSGHKSDAVDCYAITSDEQRKGLSRIISEKPSTITSENAQEKEKDVNVAEQIEAKSVVDEVSVKTDKSTNTIKVDLIGSMIQEIVKSGSGKSKTRIKIEIEIIHEHRVKCTCVVLPALEERGLTSTLLLCM